jgi:hypothetical protein
MDSSPSLNSLPSEIHNLIADQLPAEYVATLALSSRRLFCHLASGCSKRIYVLSDRTPTFLWQCLDGEVSQADLDLIDHVTVRSFPTAELMCTSCEYLRKRHGSNLINLPKTDSVVFKNAKFLKMTHSAVSEWMVDMEQSRRKGHEPNLYLDFLNSFVCPSCICFHIPEQGRGLTWSKEMMEEVSSWQSKWTILFYSPSPIIWGTPASSASHQGATQSSKSTGHTKIFCVHGDQSLCQGGMDGLEYRQCSQGSGCRSDGVGALEQQTSSAQ